MAPRRPVATVTNDKGQPLGFVSAGPDGLPDPILASVLQAYAAQQAAAEAHRQRIRQGLCPPPAPVTTWAISDRD